MFYTLNKIGKQLVEIKEAIYREVQEIPRFKFSTGEHPGAAAPDFDDSGWADFQLWDYWGGYDIVAWFRATVEVPPAWRDKKVALRLLPGPRDGGDSTAEALLYVNGAPLQGIDIWHEEAWLPPALLAQGRLSIALKAWSGVLGVPDRRRFKAAQLIWIDEPTEKFFHLADTLRLALHELDENDLRHVQLLTLLNEAFLKLDFTEFRSTAFYESVAAAYAFLHAEVVQRQALEEVKPHVSGVGHAHIDMAWLWRLSHSREKAARTFATVLHLMEQYPEYRFIHSSPQLYKYLEADYPDLFARVKEKIASGAWEITGGMWIESDTNIPSGESLIRQFLLGKRYMAEEFGVTSKLLWLPDVFGYSWALPQIARKSGMEYFLTSKISWSQYNRFPYDTFRWRGIDGTEMLTHFVTTPEEGVPFYTYNGKASPADLRGIWENYKQKDKNEELLLLFGWGDGGGGPTKEMLESGRALRNLPGLPSYGQDTPEAYFARLAARMAGQSLPVWDGELYMEYHRGTYTSQAAAKRANRRSEVLYHNAEWLSALADILTGGSAYPAAALREGWELILLNQFHDILPGSSIRQVYEDSALDYARVQAIGATAVAAATDTLAAQIQAPGDGLLAFNSLAWPRAELAAVPWPDTDAPPPPAQLVREGDQTQALVWTPEVPALGYRALAWDEARTPVEDLTITPTRLESPFYRLALNARGQITSLLDKRHGREVLAPGARANVLQTFVDKPMAFDAWDIDIYYQDLMTEVGDLQEAAVEEVGPLRGTLRLVWRFHHSTITQRLTLYQHTPRIDFRTAVDWQEKQILLKVAFPVDIRATRATYDIQFGQIERPNHWNTSWDLARFEVPAQKWADLSEGDYGVALLNDCKYGYDIKENVLRLTLIKSAVRPDALADKGAHEFTYSLLPHAGDWRAGGVIQEAYALNNPLPARTLAANPRGTLPAQQQFAATDSDHVIIETVKRAEDGDAWVVRLYETKQMRGPVTVTFGRALAAVRECNLVEEPATETAVPFAGAAFTFPLAPYEIKTFKIVFADG